MGRALEMLVYAAIVVLVIGGALYLLAFYANENSRDATRSTTQQPVSQSPAGSPPAAPPQAGSGSR